MKETEWGMVGLGVILGAGFAVVMGFIFHLLSEYWHKGKNSETCDAPPDTLVLSTPISRNLQDASGIVRCPTQAASHVITVLGKAWQWCFV